MHHPRAVPHALHTNEDDMSPRPCYRRLPLAGLLALALGWGCDSPTASPPGEPAALDVVSGDLQTQTVGTELAQQLVVRVSDDKGKPVEGQIINFRVTAGNGSVFAGAAITDEDGQARERWTLGTVAGDTQRVEARAVEPQTGEALVFAVFRAVGTAGPAASIVAVGSTSLAGLPSLPLADSVAVYVRDAHGNAVAGQAVTWTVQQGGGTASPPTSTTGANGVARTSWTLGPQFGGAQVLQAAAGTALTTQFTANVQFPPDAVLVKVSGDAQTGTAGQVLPQPLVLRVQRADGTPLAGVPVTFTLPGGGGSMNPSTAVTGADGTVSASWTVGTAAGGYEGTAAIPTGSSVTFTAQAGPGPAASLQKIGGDAQSGNVGNRLQNLLSVRVLDAYGNVPNVTVTWTPSAGSVDPATSTPDAAGYAATSYTLPATPGPVTVQASVPGLAPVTFGATAISTAVHMRVLQPVPNAVAGDSLRVLVRVDSARASIASLVASALGRSTTLQPGTNAETGSLVGMLGLAGTPHGPAELRVVATTVDGDSSVIVVPFTHDAPPTISMTAPLRNTVARPQIRLDADCTDDGPAGCTSLVARVWNADLGNNPQTVASGTTGIHTSVSLAAWEGMRVRVEFRATDSRGQVRTVADTAFVESSTALTEIASAGSRVWDVDLGRVLFSDTAGSVYLRAGSTETLLAPGVTPRVARLHPQGAIFGGGRVYDWRGTLVDLGTLSSQLEVSGSWAIWNNSARDLFRRDLAAGTHVQLSADAFNIGNDVTESGVVVYTTGGQGTSPSDEGYDVYRFDGSGTTRITADADATAWNVYPVTDGTNVVYRTTAQGGSTSLQPGHIALWRDGVETLLTTVARDVQPRRDYDATNGWVAFTERDAGSILQIYTRAPDGTVRRATSVGSSASLRGLGPDGTVLYASGGSVYAIRAPYSGAPVRIANDWSFGTFRFDDDDVLLFLGRTAFRATF
jgi:hypothetical protein